jgi:cyclophilin family peptidyl-prolyl cis-trans isomerase
MCANFAGLADGSLAPQNGKPFYHGLTFYRVVPGFVIQSGNPGLKDTDDDPVAHPHRFPDEFVPGLRHDAAGILSMANAGPDTNSCEFFLTLAPVNRLNYLHSVFGRVESGLDVLPLIKEGDAVSIKILRVGTAAQAFQDDAAAFAARAAAAKKYSGEPMPGPAAHFDDPDHLLPQDVPRAKNFNFQLANFERTTGVRIVARFFAKEPPAAEDEVPGAYMRALATRLGTVHRGALVAYFAAEDDWRVWVGDESTAAFFGGPTTAADLVRDGAFHRVKEAFMDAAMKAGDEEFARQQKDAPAGRQPTAAQHLKLRTDAVLDGLIVKLEPK